MATILLGYDTETAAVGEALSLFTESPNFSRLELALEPRNCGLALELLTQIHDDLEVSGTLFVCGRTLIHALEPIRAAKASGLFDVQQHTFSHVPFRDVHYEAGDGRVATIPASPHEALRAEVEFTSQLLRDHLGQDCVGIRTPFGHHLGLRRRPELLEILARADIRYVTSWGRNEANENPTPWIQPFTYDDEGYPGLLEIPFQFWLDVVWFDQHGYDTGAKYLAALKGAVDEIVEQDLVYGTCFHDWVMLASEEERVGWLRGFLTYAKERGVEIATYTEFWQRTVEAAR